VSRGTQAHTRASAPFRLRGSHPLWPRFPPRSTRDRPPRGHSVECPGVAYNPARATATASARGRFGLVPFRSPLLRESRLISVPRGTKMFQFPRFPPSPYGFRTGCMSMTPCALPHSGIPGSTPADGSPRLFAAYHALHRLLAPRHPPYALGSAASAPARTPHTPALRLFLASMQLFRSWAPPHALGDPKLLSRRPPRELARGLAAAPNDHSSTAASRGWVALKYAEDTKTGRASRGRLAFRRVRA
jgi:hypothetical protein